MAYLLMSDKSKVELKKDILTIGSMDDNDIIINDGKISRHHAQIVKEDNGYFIYDLDSTNGTFVNNQVIKKQLLTHEDLIRCGTTEFYFLEAISTKVFLDKSKLTGDIIQNISTITSFIDQIEREGSTISQSRISLNYLMAKLQQNVTTLQKTYKKLLALYGITQKLNSSLELETILNNMIDSAIDFCSASRGFVILFNKKGELEIKIARRMNMEESEANNLMNISKSIAVKVAKTGEPIVTENAYNDVRFSAAESVISHQISSSIVCLPLISKGIALGAMYLDSNVKEGTLDDGEMDFLMALANQAALAIENARLYQEELKREHIKHELLISSKIQEKILPDNFPSIKGMQIFGKSIPAKEVGGDYFNVFHIDDENKLIFCIADVSGKSISAAIVVSMFHSMIRVMIESRIAVSLIFEKINNAIIADIYEGMYITGFICSINIQSGEYEFVNAGHNPPIHIKCGEKKIIKLESGGTPLGMFENALYKKGKGKLEENDSIFCYTDGVTECLDKKNRMFGNKQLLKFLKETSRYSSEEIIKLLFKALELYSKGAEQNDDITALCVKR